jgi:hypothetical protein
VKSGNQFKTWMKNSLTWKEIQSRDRNTWKIMEILEMKKLNKSNKKLSENHHQ